jgi:hypothetical protein
MYRYILYTRPQNLNHFTSILPPIVVESTWTRASLVAESDVAASWLVAVHGDTVSR